MVARSVRDVLVFNDEPDHIVCRLRERHPKQRFHACRRYRDLPDALAEIEPQVVFATKFEPIAFPREPLVKARSVEWLSIGFAGVDHVVPWDDERLIVTNAAGVASEEIAQYVVGAIYGLHQRFPQFASQQAERTWQFEWIRSARSVTVGVVGLGHTGRAVAQLCRANGFKVVACRSSGEASPLVDQVFATSDLKQMLSVIDVAVVCAALTPATRDLFDQSAFEAMQHGSYFVNVSRGGLVDEIALVAALRSEHLAGAFLDVVRTEPLPSDDSLWDTPNCFITPHTCSEYKGWVEDAGEMFSDNLVRWLEGVPLKNVVRSGRGY